MENGSKKQDEGPSPRSKFLNDMMEDSVNDKKEKVRAFKKLKDASNLCIDKTMDNSSSAGSKVAFTYFPFSLKFFSGSSICCQS